MTRPTDEQLAAWRRLADAATAGPWEHEADEISPPATVLSGFVNVVGGPSLFRPGVNNPNVYADAAFIVSAREAVPALLDEVARLRAVVDALPRCDEVPRDCLPCENVATRTEFHWRWCDAHGDSDARDLPYAAALRALLTSPPPAPPGFDANGSPVE